jgi:quinol monooxygenase YgiN
MSKRNENPGKRPQSGLVNRRESLAAGIGLVAAVSLGTVAVAEESRMPVVRMADLEIDPAQLVGFTAAVKEEMEISVRVEPGVLAIYAVAEKDSPAKLRFFEMYADDAAYKAHIDSAHFKKYVATTKAMIVSRKPIDVISRPVERKGKMTTNHGPESRKSPCRMSS